MLLSKAYETLPSGGGLINYEPIIDDRREHNAFGFLMSLNILIETNGGFDYTGADRCGWMAPTTRVRTAAGGCGRGFREARVEHLAGPDSQAPTPWPRLHGPDSQAPTPRPRPPGPDSMVIGIK